MDHLRVRGFETPVSVATKPTPRGHKQGQLLDAGHLSLPFQQDGWGVGRFVVSFSQSKHCRSVQRCGGNT